MYERKAEHHNQNVPDHFQAIRWKEEAVLSNDRYFF